MATAAVVLIAVLAEPRVLLLRHTGGVKDGRWGLPGGKRQPGETVLDAAARELAEETGLRLHHPRVVTELVEGDWHAAVVCGHTEGEITASAEGVPVWWEIGALAQLPLLPHVERMVEAARR